MVANYFNHHILEEQMVSGQVELELLFQERVDNFFIITQVIKKHLVFNKENRIH